MSLSPAMTARELKQLILFMEAVDATVSDLAVDAKPNGVGPLVMTGFTLAWWGELDHDEYDRSEDPSPSTIRIGVNSSNECVVRLNGTDPVHD